MSNGFETGKQKVIPAVLLYAFHHDPVYGERVLMLHARGKDGMPGKWNGLGGKLEPGESIKDAAVREFSEEALCLTQKEQWHWLGQLYFPNFKAHKNEDWWVTVLITELSDLQLRSIKLHDENAPEGPLSLLNPSEVMTLDLWDGDLQFLPFIFRKIPFEGTFFYKNGACTQFELAEISAVLGPAIR